MARKYHPDLNPTPEAHRKFQQISKAYEILSDSTQRQKYDNELAGKKKQQQKASRTNVDWRKQFRGTIFTGYEGKPVVISLWL